MVTKKDIEAVIENKDEVLTHIIEPQLNGHKIAILQEYKGADVILAQFESRDSYFNMTHKLCNVRVIDIEVISDFKVALEILGYRILMS